jgi:hypothetical protein
VQGFFEDLFRIFKGSLSLFVGLITLKDDQQPIVTAVRPLQLGLGRSEFSEFFFHRITLGAQRIG